MSRFSPYSRRALRALIRRWVASHRRLALVAFLIAVALVAFETVLAMTLWNVSAMPYVLGLLHASTLAAIARLVAMAFFAHNREAIGHLRGAWGEDSTRDELQRAKRKGLVWGSVHSVNLQFGDIDHLVVTRRGGLVAIDTKWRSESFTDRDEMARSAAKVRVRAEALTRTLLRGERGSHRASTNPLSVLPVIVLWGRAQRELPDRAHHEGIEFIPGHRLVDWLRELDGATINKDAAKDLLRRLEDFRAEAWEQIPAA